MSIRFKEGDVVRLKSGGPMMTVSRAMYYSYTLDGADIYCQWFVGNSLQSQKFPHDVLEIVTTAPPPA
jgi:uncharacterized protein YodC (DUF2158 family)